MLSVIVHIFTWIIRKGELFILSIMDGEAGLDTITSGLWDAMMQDSVEPTVLTLSTSASSGGGLPLVHEVPEAEATEAKRRKATLLVDRLGEAIAGGKISVDVLAEAMAKAMAARGLGSSGSSSIIPIAPTQSSQRTTSAVLGDKLPKAQYDKIVAEVSSLTEKVERLLKYHKDADRLANEVKQLSESKIPARMKKFTIVPRLEEHDEVLSAALPSLNVSFQNMTIYQAREHLYLKTQGWLKAVERNVIVRQIEKATVQVEEEEFKKRILALNDPQVKALDLMSKKLGIRLSADKEKQQKALSAEKASELYHKIFVEAGSKLVKEEEDKKEFDKATRAKLERLQGADHSQRLQRAVDSRVKEIL